MDNSTLEEEALKLPPAERIQLADLLIASVETESIQERLDHYGREADDRIDAYDRGEIEAVDADIVMERLRKQFC